ncbi:hypothetical protein F5B19DRAFT_493902 [Rostrohypoxylon terebratum]|nr:hypothetical protein F5B19DRAFT_493902 [Rostrohypoxylon terebratum]
MATPTLVNSWTPTVSGCIRSGDFWIWDYEVNMNQRTVLGGPSQIQQCFPSSWDGTKTYAGTGCPSAYTSACRGTDSAAAVTCCPWAYAFTCQPQTTGGLDRESFRCMSQYTGADKVVVTRTALKVNTITFETRAMDPSLHLFALAVIYTTPAATATADSSIPTSSATGASEAPQSATLTPGQAAGIGVGAGAGIFLLGIFISFLIWRRRKMSDYAENARIMAQYPPPPKPRELPTISEPSELDSVSGR